MNKLRSSDENLGAPYTDRGGNLLEWLYQLRDRQREQQGKGAWLIKGRDLPWENNRQGKMKWFLHPALDNTAIRSMIIFEQEIPAGGRSGAQKSPGGSVLYILAGKATRCSTASVMIGRRKTLSISRFVRRGSWCNM